MNATYRNGIVREVDGKRGLARVEFTDQDGMASWWLSVSQPLAGSSRVYSMPDVGSQVTCMTDERGEEGVIIGAIYSDKDVPPTDNANEIKTVLAGGRAETYDKSSGEYHVQQSAKYVIDIGAAHVEISPDKIVLQVGGTSLVISDGHVSASGPFSHSGGDVSFGGGSLTHDGRNIGSTHVHGGVQTGGEKTAPPE